MSAGGAGGIPVPLVSEGLLVPIQVGMLVYISRVFGVNGTSAEFWRNLVIDLLASLTGVIIEIRSLGNILKFIPGVGPVFGGVILGSSSAILTFNLGNWYIDFLVKQITDSGGIVPSMEVITQGLKDFSGKIQKGNFKVVKDKT